MSAENRDLSGIANRPVHFGFDLEAKSKPVGPYRIEISPELQSVNSEDPVSKPARRIRQQTTYDIVNGALYLNGRRVRGLYR